MKSSRIIPVLLLAAPFIAATATQPGCSDNQPGADAPVSIEEIEEADGEKVKSEAVDPPAETEEVVAAKEEWFTTESVDGEVAITGWKRDVELPSEPEPSASEPEENALREWTDSTSAYRIKAAFEGRDGSKVKLRREDGKLIVMPISKLSDDDQNYLNNH